MHDVAVVGGGPAGLAVAIGAALRGLDVVVLERKSWPVDKACGEGLMPSGVRALERLGVKGLLNRSTCAPFVGVRYLQEDGSSAEACFPEAPGLGVRRTALSAALVERAQGVGVKLLPHTALQTHRRLPSHVELDTGQGRIDAKLLIAADGMNSQVRLREGLDVRARGARRFGMRQHFRLAPWSSFVEVHFSYGVEAYVTPAGSDRVGVAFLWEDGRVAAPVSFQALLARFPRLVASLSGSAVDSERCGLGPLRRTARQRTLDRLVLLGDAGGYVDAITGEGVSLALQSAEGLAAILPEALERGATRDSLRAFELSAARAFSRYSRLTNGMLLLAKYPKVRRRLIHGLGRYPSLGAAVLGWVSEEHALAGTRALVLAR
jgi:flavin-dependent dehydrogenase